MRGFVPRGLGGWVYALVGRILERVGYISECLQRASNFLSSYMLRSRK